MADLRCPMCGKSNPPEAENCQYCQARLTPLLPTPPGLPPEEGGEADWLRGLRDDGLLGEQPPAAPEESAAPLEETPPEGEMPDWLARIRQRTQVEEDAVSPIGPAPKVDEERGEGEEEIPEWLRDLPLTGTDASGIPAWMQDIRPAGEEPATRPSGADEQLEGSPVEASSGLDNDAWLASLGEWASQTAAPGAEEAAEPAPLMPEEAQPAEALRAEETPDWLQALDKESAAPALDEQDNQDWLPKAEGEAQEAPTGVESASWPPPIEETPPAFATEESAPAESTPQADVPDWLTPLEAEAAGPIPEEPTPAERPPSTGMTDWLRSLEAQSAAPASQEPAPAESIPAADMADWLKSFQAEAEGAAAPPEEPALPAPPERPTSTGMTDWLRSLDAEAAPPPVESAPAAEQPLPESEGDWLASLEQSAAGLPPTEPEGAQSELPIEGVPDWLSAFASEETPPAPAFTETPEAAPAENLPEWLRAVEPQQPAPNTPAFASAEETKTVSPFSSEELSDWGSASEQAGAAESYELPAFTVETEESSAGEAQPALGEQSIPDWLSEEAPAEVATTEGLGESLEQAQLPAWLQAMRPLDSAVQGRAANLDEERIEKTGPLAGMSGVLPGEEVVTRYRKPPAYSARLRVSDKQQVLANLLESVVAEENLAQPLQSEQTQAPQFIIRLLVGLLLIGAVSLALLIGNFISVPKGQIAAGTPANDIFRQLDDLPAGSPVLVAVDYEAGLSGEMKAAALPVIQHLMNRKVRIVLVSTQAVGPVLAEDLLRQAAAGTRGGVTTYAIPQSSANLGYLVGGAIGLKEFAAPMSSEHPRPLQQALPTPLRALDGWDGLVLKSLSQITDFKRVILLTDSIETGRAWVEQVQPSITRRVPFIVISSAQAAPLLQPYQASGQIYAMLSGLVGGRAYEEMTRRPAVAGAYWSAYQVGLALAVLVILLGGLLAGGGALLKRAKKQNQARG